ncbi:uncharacterized protein LOC103471756 [Poecilia reticulata]|uniref:uncharacterized protein LOC103471756 n=1 Tax=Poecilia reticulata TaxID=8081 RepID=UPI0004A3D7D2|nr:PREDICTED: uncharacterized protein LOC103471756 [Poecilia reticulata]
MTNASEFADLEIDYCFIPVMQVQLGEPAAFQCVLPKLKFIQKDIYWYKQSPGDTLRLLLKLTMKHQQPTISKFGKQFSGITWRINNDDKTAMLTILRTTNKDLGTYHCAIKSSAVDFEWSATNLILKGKTKSNIYTKNRICPGDINMLWFSAKINCTNENKCGDVKRCDSLMNCFHHFMRHIMSSDAAPFYCGETHFGNGTKLETEKGLSLEVILLLIAVTSLITSVIVNIAFLCDRSARAMCKQFTGTENTSLPTRRNTIKQNADRVEDENNGNYAALNFSESKERKTGRKAMEMNIEESVYSQIKF